VRERFGIEPIPHFVCRERTAAEIENDLMDLHLLGIANVLALRGDAPAGAKDEAWDGDYRYAWQLVEQITRLNRGKYLPRKGVETEPRDGMPTDFCTLVAGHPEDPIAEEIAHLRPKIEAGAQAIITQMIFTFEEYRGYVEALRAAGITLPVLAGVRPLMTLREMEAAESFFGLTVDPALKEGMLTAGSDVAVRRFCTDHFHDVVARLRAYGAPGVHLFVLNNVGLVDELGLAWQPTLV
jgi:methylenetetrahydrofolate reductase (NADPH)